MATNERLIVGTWGLSGAFGPVDRLSAEAVICEALEAGITDFDTALVYGRGSMESLLGDVCPPHARIATKIPAIQKPDPAERVSDFEDFYGREHVHRCVEQSLERLRRSAIDVLQLHNWHPSWDARSALDVLLPIKERGIARRIGVSLPDGFNGEPPNGFDVVQAPYNVSETWAARCLANYRGEVWARSVFAHGALTGSLDFPSPTEDGRKEKFEGPLRLRATEALRDIKAGPWNHPREAALNLPWHQGWIDRLIIGFRNKGHVQEVLDIIRGFSFVPPHHMGNSTPSNDRMEATFDNLRFIEDGDTRLEELCTRLSGEAASEGIRKLVGGAVVLHDRNALIMTRSLSEKHAPGLPEIPGGGIDEDENLLTGVRRELREEAGITDMRIDRLIGSFDIAFKNVRTRQFIFLVRVDSDRIVMNPEEHADYLWLDLSQENALEGFGFHSPGEAAMLDKAQELVRGAN